jgi:hypothetical protein
MMRHDNEGSAKQSKKTFSIKYQEFTKKISSRMMRHDKEGPVK